MAALARRSACHIYGNASIPSTTTGGYAATSMVTPVPAVVITSTHKPNATVAVNGSNSNRDVNASSGGSNADNNGQHQIGTSMNYPSDDQNYLTYELTDIERGLEALLEKKLHEGSTRPLPAPRSSRPSHMTSITGSPSVVSFPAAISGIDEFTQSCAQLRIAPSAKVARQLTTTELRLAHYGLGPTGAIAVAAALRINRCVQCVDLDDNALTDDGVATIVSVLCSPPPPSSPSYYIPGSPNPPSYQPPAPIQHNMLSSSRSNISPRRPMNSNTSNASLPSSSSSPASPISPPSRSSQIVHRGSSAASSSSSSSSTSASLSPRRTFKSALVESSVRTNGSEPHSHQHSSNGNGHRMTASPSSSQMPSSSSKGIPGAGVAMFDVTADMALSSLPGMPLSISDSHLQLSNSYSASVASLLPIPIPSSLPLAYNTNIRSLDLSRNTLGPPGVAAIAAMILANRTLTSLSLSRTELSDSCVENIAEALGRHPSLDTLDLSANKINDRGGIAIAAMLATNSVLADISVAWNSITERGAEAMAASLSRNNGSGIVAVNLSWNAIGNKGGIAFANLLAEADCGLQWLDLAHNKLEGTFWSALSRSLPGNDTLKTLLLGGNYLEPSDAPMVKASLLSNQCLEAIEIEGLQHLLYTKPLPPVPPPVRHRIRKKKVKKVEKPMETRMVRIAGAWRPREIEKKWGMNRRGSMTLVGTDASHIPDAPTIVSAGDGVLSMSVSPRRVTPHASTHSLATVFGNMSTNLPSPP